MFTVTQRIRIEWAHCDPARIIFNPHYYIWMDSGTHALLQASGFDFIAETRSSSDFLGCPLVPVIWSSNGRCRSAMWWY
jgi:4-hydroxybenzoyl-CoA thioesterase